jgi:hypothetical protein
MEKDNHKRCIAVDFDSTLAHYETFVSPDNVGAPIPEMVRKVKQAMAEGATVVIFTARVNPGEGNAKDSSDATIAYLAIAEWSKKVFGKVLPITHEKSRHFTEIWDDRAKQVIPNTGVFVTELLAAHGANR